MGGVRLMLRDERLVEEPEERSNLPEQTGARWHSPPRG
jgi:hypothetical protein